MKKRYLSIVVLCTLVFQTAWGATPEELSVKGPESARLLTFQHIEGDKLLVSVTDAAEKPIVGLTPKDFTISKGIKTAKIVNVEPLVTNKEVGLHIVMVVDNSQSMENRRAVKPLLEALDAFYETLRPIDTVCAVVFDDKNTIQVAGKDLHAKVLKTNNVDELRVFLETQMTKGMTGETFLYDAMMVGLDQARGWPDKSNKFMVVFSDGEDLNSTIKKKQLEANGKSIPNFAAYTVDFMPDKTPNMFLKSFALQYSGQSWKAGSSSELLPIFKKFSSTLLYRYVVSYRFLNPPTGAIAFAPAQVTIEEVTTIDSAPLLNYVFFDTGQSELSDRYVQYKAQADTQSFSEAALQGALEKYNHVLNIIGQRMHNHADAVISIVGCNSNTGQERGRSDLSMSRAESVRAYLRYVWGIDSERMTVETRNLPEAPSTSRIPEGQAENQRVEIHSKNPAILDTVNSEYVTNVCNVEALKLVPAINAEAGINEWQITLRSGDQEIGLFSGQGEMAPSYVLPLEKDQLDKMAAAGTIQASLKVTDKEGNALDTADAGVLPVRFVKRQERLAQKQGYKVREQYALILFDYDSAAIKARNQAIVGRIANRINVVPQAAVDIVGHTDSIGKESYNIQLSQRRAEAVKRQFLEVGQPVANNVNVTGAGPNSPLYDNTMPEGRALNRTVTIALEYEKLQ
jgi:outer membrane protein OmpA-like peptidoglycan-associated protein/Mg-chelatase subunit ChlD